MTVMRRLLAVAACGLPLLGCQVRDEEPRSRPAAAWLETAGRRLNDGRESPRSAGSVDDGGAVWIDGFEAGSRRAAAGNLPMLLLFRADWCRWSSGFGATPPPAGGLSDAADRIVFVTIDADREAAICRGFGVDTFPTMIVLDGGRHELFRATGAEARRGLAAAVQAAGDEAAGRIATRPTPPAR